MAAFQDRHGVDWQVPGFTLGDFPRFRAVGVDLGAAMRDSTTLADILFGDVERLGRFAFTLCEKQAAERNVSPEQFAGGFDGPTLERFGEAVAEAVADFFPRSKVAAAIKGRVKAGLEKMDEEIIKAIAKMSNEPAGGSPASSGLTAPA